MSRYVDINITRQTQATSQKGFGMPLILSGDKVAAYKEYSGDTALATIGTDFGPTTKTYKIAAAILGQNPRPDKIAITGISFTEGTTAVTALSAALNTLVLTNNDWFYLLSTLQADASITALSTWAAAQEKFYFASTSSKTLANTLNSQNTIILVHDQPELNPAAAWVGACATLQPGSFTWTFKRLNGIPAAAYNGTDVKLIEDNKASTYVKEGGVDITSKGQTTSGEYIDIIQSMYYIKARMAENVFGLLVREPKVPFTDAGIGMTLAELENALQESFNIGIIAASADGEPMYSLSAPTREEISQNDKANRTLPNVKWEATIAGAVENVKVSGTLVL